MAETWIISLYCLYSWDALAGLEGGEALTGLAAVSADTADPQDRAWYQMVQVWLAVHHHPPQLRLDSAWLAATLHNMVRTKELPYV